MYPNKLLLRNILIFAIIIQLGSCSCPDVNCAGLEAWYAAWLNNNAGDIVKFRNDNGNEIIFTITDKSLSKDTTINCYNRGFTCICHDCQTRQSFSFGETADTSRKLVDSFGVTRAVFNKLSLFINEFSGPNGEMTLSYGILDHTNRIPIDSGYMVYGNDSLKQQLSLGVNTYNNVYIHHSDTTIALNPPYPHVHDEYFVITSYFTKEYGVVGFYDQLTQSLFYRE